MAKHSKNSDNKTKKANPWAICNSMAKKKGWDRSKTERCIKEVKRKK